MSNVVVLITGANRGIGLELAKQYLISGFKVIATFRDKSGAAELISLTSQFSKTLQIESLDIASHEQIEALANKLSHEDIKIDLIVNNAGYLDRENISVKAINYAHAEMSLKVNSLGPLYLTHCFLSLMNKEGLSKIAIVSSDMGSLSLQQSVAWYGYRMSKAAVNMLAVNLSSELADDNIAVVAIHPGWVKTDMGGTDANYDVKESAAGIMKVITNLTINNSGDFYDFNGNALPF
ncbi:SDR family oxidoreductase [uncultured Paraglaciecola sp.]|jgi:NAD(P)-dependent dehydrogenase (short-subunit alcohol dehydrogenase family)|uniref:SDR family oxidoreductase n=1 Tax=uncultured Paraglaciecola sp. TaxID=1765024 RepID=UPI0025F46AF2|nr:SDR family oxidoreductase [uncultured Paraglaciecola sp.]